MLTDVVGKLNLRDSQMFTRSKILSVGALPTFALATLAVLGCYVSKEGQARIKELQQLAADTDKFSDFKQVDYSHVSKSERTVIAYFYSSAAPYDQVKQFYTRTLSEKGWTVHSEESMNVWLQQSGSRLTFTKGQYTIDLEHAGDSDGGYQYAVDYAWSNQE